MINDVAMTYRSPPNKYAALASVPSAYNSPRLQSTAAREYCILFKAEQLQVFLVNTLVIMNATSIQKQ